MDFVSKDASHGVTVRLSETELDVFCKAAEKVRYQMFQVQHAFELMEEVLSDSSDMSDARLSSIAALAACALGMTADREGDEIELFADTLRRILEEARNGAE